MKVKVKVDDKVCIGSGSCVVIASDHFTLGKKGKALPIQTAGEKPTENERIITVSASKIKQLVEAARACPTQAISIVDESGKKIY